MLPYLRPRQVAGAIAAKYTKDHKIESLADGGEMHEAQETPLIELVELVIHEIKELSIFADQLKAALDKSGQHSSDEGEL